MEKTYLVVDKGTYCYRIMLFGLKNVVVTYQRLVSQIFKEKIGITMEVYVDGMVVKSKWKGDHLDDLVESFNLLCKY